MSKSGKIIWLHWTSIYFPDKEVVFALAKDVTERKLVELEMEEEYHKFKKLASHFKTAMESDRRSLAMELHEDLAQLASVVKMDLDWLGDQLDHLSLPQKKRLTHALETTGQLIQTIRRLSFSISPNLLEDVGFDEAMKWLCREFSVLNGINCQYSSHYDTERLTEEGRLDFFRICQHALSTIICHANPSEVHISVEELEGKVCLRLTNYGHQLLGIQNRQSAFYAIFSKRIATINGRLFFEIAEETGSLICVVIDVIVH